MAKKNSKSRPQITLYRNIAITFVILTAMLIGAAFLFFYHQAMIIITPAEQPMNLSFNAEVKFNPAASEIANRDMVKGSLVSENREASSISDVLSTKTVTSELVGKVKIINQSAQDQPLMKTTQLSDVSGTIVRLNKGVIVPKGGSMEVAVYPKDPANFREIVSGSRLTIIKLKPTSQEKIYALATEKLTQDPREVKVLAVSDISRAKDELIKKLAGETRQSANLDANSAISAEIISFKTDRKIGDEAEQFNLSAKVKVEYLSLDKNQLLELVKRKIKNLDLAGLKTEEVNSDRLKYSLVMAMGGGDALIRVEYVLNTILDESNEFLAKKNFIGKPAVTVKEFLRQSNLVKEANIIISPYWQKTLPKNSDKIKIIIRF